MLIFVIVNNYLIPIDVSQLFDAIRDCTNYHVTAVSSEETDFISCDSYNLVIPMVQEATLGNIL